MAGWFFIPQPVEVQEDAGHFSLGQRLTIVLPAAADEQDLFAARWLQSEIHGYTGISVPLEKRMANNHPGPAIVLARAERDAAFLALDPLPALRAQGYYARIDAERMLLLGEDAPGLFYAVQTIAQLICQAGKMLPRLTILDHPALPVRGVLLDVSRGKVPTLETLLEVVEILAGWKINQFQLYIEHAFHWPSHPLIAKGYDPLSADDLLAVDAACAQRHIDFVPNLQSFGHQGHLLRLPKYAPLAESDEQWTLAPSEPGSYALLDDLYAEFLPNFRSHLFNVDADETWDLGSGKSAARVAEVGLGRVYLEHILRLRELAAHYGRRIMCWGDVILSAPELIPELPDDMIVLCWDYNAQPNEAHVRQFAEAGKPFYVCPSVHGFGAFFPRQRIARQNIRAHAAYGVQYGARGLLNTDWGDAGHSNLQGLSYYGYAFGAAESWRPGSTEHFDVAFGRLFFGTDGPGIMAVMQLLERVDDPAEGITVADFQAYHQPFLQGVDFRDTLTPEATEIMRASAKQALGQLKRLRVRTRYPLVIEELWMAALQDHHFAEKAALAVTFHRRYADVRARNDLNGLKALKRAMRAPLRRLAKMTAAVPRQFALLWQARAHTSGLHEMTEYQLTVPADLLAAEEWLTDAYAAARRTGRVPPLPEATAAWRPECESPNGLILRTG